MSLSIQNRFQSHRNAEPRVSCDESSLVVAAPTPETVTPNPVAPNPVAPNPVGPTRVGPTRVGPTRAEPNTAPTPNDQGRPELTNLREALGTASAREPKFPRIGILNDYVRVPYANGSSFASQFLHREFRRRGSEVTVVGPNDPKAKPEELPESSVCLASLPF